MNDLDKLREEVNTFATKMADRILIEMEGVDLQSYKDKLILELEITYIEGRLSKGRSLEKENKYI